MRALLAKVSDLAARGTAPDRVRREVEAAVEGWLAEATDDEGRAAVAERVEEARAELDAGLADAREGAADLERGDAAGARQADKALAALAAARDALDAARAGLKARS